MNQVSKVQRWLNYIKDRRENSGQSYSMAVKRFEETMNIKADDLLTMNENKRIDTLETYLSLISKLAPKTKNFYVCVIKSFLSFYRCRTRLNMRITGVNRTPTLKDEKIPEPQQVRELLNRLPPRLTSAAALIGFAGLRFETQVKLQLEDLIDFDVAELKFTRNPALIYVPEEKSKNSRQYFTFLIKEGCEIIEAYLRNRKQRGEQITKDTLVIANLRGEQIEAATIGLYLNKYSKEVLHTRPYVLRSYFNTSLLAAGVHPDWKRFFTGHKGDIEELYSTRKQLPDFALEKMREAFQPAANQIATRRLDTKDQERAAALTTMKILEGYVDKLGDVNPEVKKSLKELHHQLEITTSPNNREVITG